MAKEKDDDRDLIIQQWQTCVEMANAVSERRDNTNNIFITLNLAIIAAISFIWDIKSLVLSIAGILICIGWFMFLRNFRGLNSAKYQVINEMEKKLPVKAFEDEWKNIKQNKKYLESSKLERFYPSVFIFIYIVTIVAIVIGR